MGPGSILDGTRHSSMNPYMHLHVVAGWPASSGGVLLAAAAAWMMRACLRLGNVLLSLSEPQSVVGACFLLLHPLLYSSVASACHLAQAAVTAHLRATERLGGWLLADIAASAASRRCAGLGSATNMFEQSRFALLEPQQQC